MRITRKNSDRTGFVIAFLMLAASVSLIKKYDGSACVFLVFWLIVACVYLSRLLPAGMLKSVKAAPEHRAPSIDLDDEGIFEYGNDGFKVATSTGVIEIRWKEIETMIAYKVDLVTIDRICLDVFCDDNKGFKINDETPGWFQFALKTKAVFPGIDKGWDIEIIAPAFETCLTLVYSRDGQSLEESLRKHYKQ